MQGVYCRRAPSQRVKGELNSIFKLLSRPLGKAACPWRKGVCSLIIPPEVVAISHFCHRHSGQAALLFAHLIICSHSEQDSFVTILILKMEKQRHREVKFLPSIQQQNQFEPTFAKLQEFPGIPTHTPRFRQRLLGFTRF